MRIGIAALLGRLSLLAVVLAASASSTDESEFSAIVYALAVSTAVQIFLDPGAVTLLVAERLTESEGYFGAALRLQVLAAALMCAATGLTVGLAIGGTSNVLMAAGVGALAGSEGVARLGRVRWQAEARFTAYAVVDLCLGAGRVLTALALLLGATAAFAAVTVILAMVTLGVSMRVFGRHTKVRVGIGAMLSRTWSYGASTSLSAIYSYGPAIALGLFGRLREATIFALGSRLTQPLELAPSALANVLLPRLAGSSVDQTPSLLRRQIRLTVAAAVAAALLAVAAAPVYFLAVDWPALRGTVVVSLLGAALIPKFVSYQLAAAAVAAGAVRRRLLASAVVAAVAIPLLAVAAPHGAVAMAAVVISCELLLTLMLTWASARVSLPALLPN